MNSDWSPALRETRHSSLVTGFEALSTFACRGGPSAIRDPPVTAGAGLRCGLARSFKENVVCPRFCPGFAGGRTRGRYISVSEARELFSFSHFEKP